MGPAGPAVLQGFLILLSTALSKDVKIINSFVGGEIRMVPVFNGVPQGFEWKKGPDKVIEVDFPSKPEKYALFTNRSDFNDTTGVLTIKDLQLTDLGEYSAHVLISGFYKITTFQLLVYPALKKPTVNCTDTYAGVAIQCRHDPDPPTYEWYNDGQPISNSLHNSSLADQNRSLTVGPADSKSLKSLECVVKNPATENRTCVPELCFRKDSRDNLRSGLIAAVVFVLLLSLVVIFVFFNCMRRWIHGLIDQISNLFHDYQTTATNDNEAEHNSVGAINSEVGPSDSMNKGVPTKESESSSETQPAMELPQNTESYKGDEG